MGVGLEHLDFPQHCSYDQLTIVAKVHNAEEMVIYYRDFEHDSRLADHWRDVREAWCDLADLTS